MFVICALSSGRCAAFFRAASGGIQPAGPGGLAVPFHRGEDPGAKGISFVPGHPGEKIESGKKRGATAEAGSFALFFKYK